MIQEIEELSMNAWPSLQTLLLDGWVLRFAAGYTRRANAVCPLYPSSQALDARIQACERLYRDRGLPVVFKMTAAAQPANLDGVLAAQGYTLDAPTSVQTLTLSNRALAPAPCAQLTGSFSEEWLAAYCRMTGVSTAREATLRRCLLYDLKRGRDIRPALEHRPHRAILGLAQADRPLDGCRVEPLATQGEPELDVGQDRGVLVAPPATRLHGAALHS